MISTIPGKSSFAESSSSRDRGKANSSEDIADGLGIHVTEVLKRLNVLVNLGKVTSTVSGGRNFYIVKGTPSALKMEKEEGDP